MPSDAVSPVGNRLERYLKRVADYVAVGERLLDSGGTTSGRRFRHTRRIGIARV